MATKTTTEKKTTKRKNKEVVENVVAEQEVKPVQEKKEVRKYLEHDEIPVVSVTAGKLIMAGRRSGNVYQWGAIGDIEYLEYQDIKAEILNSNSRYIYDPLIIIQDEELVSQYKKVADLYKNVYIEEDLSDVVVNTTPEEFAEILKNLPKGMQNSAVTIVSTLMQEGRFDSIRKLRIIDELFNTQMSKQADLYS